jgi:2-polyprenyl-3-methyl-5-hydroxy-6-metoxy-1,4-benzoquinol methylase
MSSSLPCNIPYMLNIIGKNIFNKIDISKLDIQKIVSGEPIDLPEFSILDIGCGFGKWGFLIRDTFEVMVGQHFKKNDWKINITAVEPFPKCITTIQKEIYNKIIIKDIFDVVDELGHYDLIIMGDVIEHFDKDKAYELLDKLLNHTENILISTPLGFMPQGAWAGNEKEIHKSGWKLKDFKKYNVVEHKILKDDLFTEIISKIQSLPKDMKNSETKLIVLWVKKK